MRRKPAVIAYDISSNKRRRQVHQQLQAWKLDSQYSVFECRLSNREAEELLLQLTEMIDPKTDKLLFVWLDTKRPAKGLTKGATPKFNKPVWYIG